MPIEPKDMVDFAYDCYKRADDSKDTETSIREVGFRCASGRAYYGAFLIAREAAGIPGTGKDDHKRVADHYLSIDGKIYQKLNSMRRLRNTSDYDIDETVSRREAMKCCSDAKDIANKLS